jgi:hypothetical protein
VLRLLPKKSAADGRLHGRFVNVVEDMKCPICGVEPSFVDDHWNPVEPKFERGTVTIAVFDPRGELPARQVTTSNRKAAFHTGAPLHFPAATRNPRRVYQQYPR